MTFENYQLNKGAVKNNFHFLQPKVVHQNRIFWTFSFNLNIIASIPSTIISRAAH
jgi:hypothetical protein